MSRAIGDATLSAITGSGGVFMWLAISLPEGWTLIDDQGNPWPGPFRQIDEDPAKATLNRRDVEQLREACNDFLAGRAL